MTTKSRSIETHVFKSPHINEAFKIEVDQDEVSMLWVRDSDSMGYRTKCLLADIPKSEVILLLKEMIDKLEGGE